jgi:hypothetical protein
MRFRSAGRFPTRPFWLLHPGWGMVGNASEERGNRMRIVIEPNKCFSKTSTSNKTMSEILTGFPLSTDFWEEI